MRRAPAVAPLRPLTAPAAPTGNQYTGDVRDGKPEGQGTVFFKDGGRYEGEFKAGKKDGQGFLFFKTGSRYEGPPRSPHYALMSRIVRRP